MQLFINVNSIESANRVISRSKWILGLLVCYVITTFFVEPQPLPLQIPQAQRSLVETVTVAAKIGVIVWIIWCGIKFRRSQLGQTPWLFAFVVFELIGNTTNSLDTLNIIGLLLLVPLNVLLFNMLQAWQFLRKA